jgi:hypothetical protein
MTDEAQVDTQAAAPQGDVQAQAAPEAQQQPQTDAKGFWPEDWRNRLAGEDTKTLQRLGRFDSPEAIWKSMRSLETKLSSGEYIPKLGENPTEEEVSAYRKANGIPDDVKGYGIDTGNDEVMGSFLETALKSNMPPQYVKGAIEWYNGLQQQLETQQADLDTQTKTASEDALRSEWGGEYRGNMVAIRNHLNGAFGEEFASQLMNARTPDGVALGSNETFLKGLARVALEMNPRDTLVPAGATQQTIQTRLEEIRHIRRTEPDKYWKSETMQQEERRLIAANLKIAS